jgi:hypothetical protein
MSLHEERVKALEKQIAVLKKQWLAHSAPPAMMELLDESKRDKVFIFPRDISLQSTQTINSINN